MREDVGEGFPVDKDLVRARARQSSTTIGTVSTDEDGKHFLRARGSRPRRLLQRTLPSASLVLMTRLLSFMYIWTLLAAAAWSGVSTSTRKAAKSSMMAAVGVIERGSVMMRWFSLREGNALQFRLLRIGSASNWFGLELVRPLFGESRALTL